MRRWWLAAILCFSVWAGPAARGEAAEPMPVITADGSRLEAAGERWQAFGFNNGVSEQSPSVRYFDRPNGERLAELVRSLAEARRHGANTVRVYLEVSQFMRSPTRVRSRSLDALSALLGEAERMEIYLDLTGNLVWRPELSPAWYEAMDTAGRWQVQKRFWRSVAGVAADSPAVLAYELTSEPVVDPAGPWYAGRLDRWYFIQNIARELYGRTPAEAVRRWTAELAGAIRSRDRDHLIGLGLLPRLDEAFTRRSLRAVDLFLPHLYAGVQPNDELIAVARYWSKSGKPVIVGETYKLFAGERATRELLLGVRRRVEGYLSFLRFKEWEDTERGRIEAAIHQENLELFQGLRKRLEAR